MGEREREGGWVYQRERNKEKERKRMRETERIQRVGLDVGTIKTIVLY